FIQGSLFNLLKQRTSTIVQNNSVANLDGVADPPLAVQGQAPASGLFSFDKYSSINLLIQAAREASGQLDPPTSAFRRAQRACYPLANQRRRRLQPGSLRQRSAPVSPHISELCSHPRHGHSRIHAPCPHLVPDQWQ